MQGFDNTFRAGGSQSVTVGAATPPGIAVNQVELKPDGAGPGFDSFRAVWSINGSVEPNQRSALFAFTSNAAPSVALFSAQRHVRRFDESAHFHVPASMLSARHGGQPCVEALV